jgi:hypothetical protein
MEQIDAQQEIAFIKKVIQDSRMAVVDNGIEYIVWGLLVALGMFGSVALTHFRMISHDGSWVGWVLWIAVMGAGWTFSLIRHLRLWRHDPTETLANRILRAIWLCCGIAIMILIFVHGATVARDPGPAIALVLGIGFIMSGMLMDFAPLRWAGVCWWVGSVALLFIHSDQLELLVFGGMTIMLQVLPGVLLYRRWKHSSAAVRNS